MAPIIDRIRAGLDGVGSPVGILGAVLAAPLTALGVRTVARLREARQQMTPVFPPADGSSLAPEHA